MACMWWTDGQTDNSKPICPPQLLPSFGHNWTASSEFGTYRLCEQRRFRRACASAQSRQNLCYSLIQAVCQEEPPDRKPDPWPLWMAGHAQLKFVMTECSKTQIRLTGLIYPKIWIGWVYHNSDTFKRCRQNSKQWRLWSEHSFRNELVWVSVCPDPQSVENLNLLAKTDWHCPVKMM